MVGVVLVQVIIILGHAAETVSTDKRPQSGQKIQITADELISSGQDNYAEFIGNVEVIQGTFLIKSDRLRIYYKSFKVDSKTPSMGEESIEKIIAYGNVRIWSDDRRAEADQAEYSLADMVLVLSGDNSTVTSGKNSVTGSKITLCRRDGRIKVEGSSGKRVKAIFYQGEKAESESAGEKP